MAGHEERIFRFEDLGIVREHVDCVVTWCDRPATRWMQSQVDSKLMPACEKHYQDPKMTPRRWENARKKYEAEVRLLIGKRCFYCGKQAEGSADVDLLPALEKYGNDLRNDYVPNDQWLCTPCFYSIRPIDT